jgi:hypothetical protein
VIAHVSLPIGIAYTQLAGLPSVRTADKRGDGRKLRTGEELRRDRTEQEVLLLSRWREIRNRWNLQGLE